MDSSVAGNINDPVLFSEVLTPESCYKSHANLMENSFLNQKADMAEVNLNKPPKKVLHFSDGTIEEFSSEEDEADGKPVPIHNAVNPKTLTWGPWTWYYVSTAGCKTLQVCDYLGESLANFFGITSPKYQYEIEEYYRAKAEEEEEKKQQDLEMRGWTEKKLIGDDVPAVEVVGPRVSKTPGVIDHTLPSTQRY